jgi:predicted dehydrogenase
MNQVTRPLRWGILGTGNIANQFATGVLTARRSVLAGVGLRRPESAQAFAATHRIPIAYGSYEALLGDDGVDAIYNSLPNNLHHEWTIKALAAGKHVLCEKPFAVNLREAEEMFAAARQHGRILTEAFMYRTHPLIKEVARVVQSGAIGRLRHIRTSFCYRTTRIHGNIRFDPALAGGALMDVGCYCLNFARLFAGAEPIGVTCAGNVHETGVDDHTAGLLTFPGGLLATFACAMTVQADNTATLCGDEGFIEIPIPWKPPADNAVYTIAHSTPPRQDLTGPRPPSMTGAAPPRETRTVSTGGVGLYGVEADDFAATVLDGTPATVPPADTIGNMRLLDQIRAQVGLAY